MLESKSPLDSIYRLIASHSWMSEREAKVSLVMMYALGTKSLGLEYKSLNKFMERSLGKKMCSDNKENLKEYLFKVKINFPTKNYFLEINLWKF